MLTDFEAHRASIRGYLGSVHEGVIDYYLFRDAADFAKNSPCREGVGGCADGSSLYVPLPEYGEATSDKVHEHELIHGYLADAGSPSAVLVEGIAEVLSCASVVRGVGPTTRLAWQDAVRVSPTDMSLAGYVSSRFFVYRLLSKFGPRAFMAFYREALDTRSAALFAIQFERAFGIQVEEVWEEALVERGAATICPCAGEILSLDGVVRLVAASCRNRQRVIDVPPGRTLSLTSSAILSTSRCDGAAPRPPISFLGAGGGRGLQVLARLAPGPHVLGIGPGEDVALGGASGDWISSACGGAETFIIDSTSVVQVVVPASGDRWSVPVTAAVPLTAKARSQDDDGRAMLCSACEDSPAACQTIGQAGVQVPANQRMFLVVETEPAIRGRNDGFHVITLTPVAP